MRTVTAPTSGASSYLRQVVRLNSHLPISRLRAQVSLRPIRSAATSLLVATFSDPELRDLIHQRDSKPNNLDTWFRARVDFDLSEGPTPRFAVFQISLPRVEGAEVHVLDPRLEAIIDDGSRRSFSFHTFGDFTTASSRLRAYKLGQQLSEMGHDVTVNDPEAQADVHVFQKVRPFSRLRDARRSGALIVYDFDDDYLLPSQGVTSQVVAMMNAADLVTVGNSLLVERARHLHPRTVLFENPVDILDPSVTRPARGSLERVGWFGAPENRHQLDGVDLSETIETITRGGTIEFDIRTVDSTLVDFDVMLFPLAPTPWNLAKNANRMIKAVALGIPVLVSATPEHRRTAEKLGLDERFIVQDGESWEAKLKELRSEAASVEQTIGRARMRALSEYSTERISAIWLEAVSCTPKRHTPQRAQTCASNSASLGNIAALIWDTEADDRLDRTLVDSEVEWSDFGECYIATPFFNANTALGNEHIKFLDSKHDYFDLFQHLEESIERIECPWITVVPSGQRLMMSYTEAFEQILREQPDTTVILCRSQGLSAPADELPETAADLLDWLVSPKEPGVFLARTSWLRALTPGPTQLATYWAWYVIARALADDCLVTTPYPVTIRTQSSSIVDVSSAYSKWLRVHSPEAARNLPNLESQWKRVQFDIIRMAAENFVHILPAAYAHLAVHSHK